MGVGDEGADEVVRVFGGRWGEHFCQGVGVGVVELDVGVLMVGDEEVEGGEAFGCGLPGVVAVGFHGDADPDLVGFFGEESPLGDVGKVEDDDVCAGELNGVARGLVAVVEVVHLGIGRPNGIAVIGEEEDFGDGGKGLGFAGEGEAAFEGEVEGDGFVGGFGVEGREGREGREGWGRGGRVLLERGGAPVGVEGEGEPGFLDVADLAGEFVFVEGVEGGENLATGFIDDFEVVPDEEAIRFEDLTGVEGVGEDGGEFVAAVDEDDVELMGFGEGGPVEGAGVGEILGVGDAALASEGSDLGFGDDLAGHLAGAAGELMGEDVEGVEFEFGGDGVEVAEAGAAMGADFKEFGRGGGGGGEVVEVGADEAVEAVHLEVGAEAGFEEIREWEVVGFLEGGGGDADHGKLRGASVSEGGSSRSEVGERCDLCGGRGGFRMGA